MNFKDLIEDLIFRRLEHQKSCTKEFQEEFDKNIKNLIEILPETEEVKKLLDNIEHFNNLLTFDEMEEAYKIGFRDGMEFKEMLKEGIQNEQ